MRHTVTPKEKARNARLLKVYGITIADYNSMLAQQGGVCYICKKPPPEGRNFNVDHDHVSGKIRGILCPYCNRYRVGRQKDALIAIRIAEYLSAPPASAFNFSPVPKKKRLTRKRPRRTI
jgi:hypothetical protein